MKNQFYNFTIFPISDASKVLKSCAGSNKKGLFIFLNTKNNATSELDLLKKILAAIQFDLEEDCFLYLCTTEDYVKLLDLAKETTIKYILSFGIPPKNMGLQRVVQLYQPFVVNEQTFLFANSLDRIANEKQLKGALWGALQSVFLKK